MFTDAYRGRGVSHFMCTYALTLSLFMFFRYLQILFYTVVIVLLLLHNVIAAAIFFATRNWNVTSYFLISSKNLKAIYLNFPWHNDSRTRGFDLATRGFEVATRDFKLVTRGFELATRVLPDHFIYSLNLMWLVSAFIRSESELQIWRPNVLKLLSPCLAVLLTITYILFDMC